MKQFLSFVRKEFYHIFRDRKTMFILLGMPVVQIIIFGFALTNEVKNAKFAVLDNAHDAGTATLIQQIDASRYFELQTTVHSYQQITDAFKKGQIKMAIVIPQHFDDDLLHQNKAQVQLVADASDPNVANTLVNYASAIIMDYQGRITQHKKLPYTINTEIRMLYNPQLKGAYSFVPGVMAMVLLLVCTMMTALTIVKEKEMGTMEIMLVSPLQPLLIIIAKAVPYLLLSIVNIISILLLSVFVLEVPINGSIPLLIFESILFTIVSLSLGLLISAGVETQQTAMFISMIGMFLPTVQWLYVPDRKHAQTITGYFEHRSREVVLQHVQSVMIKGVGIEAIWKETLILFGMMVFFLGMAFKQFKIRLA